MKLLEETMDSLVELGKKKGILDMIVELRKLSSVNIDYDKGVSDCIIILVDEYNKLENKTNLKLSKNLWK